MQSKSASLSIFLIAIACFLIAPPYQANASTVIFLTTTGAGTWKVPSDWNNNDNSIECIAGGAAGGPSTSGGAGGPGGGGGAYAKISNISAAALGGLGSNVNFSVGIGGNAGSGGDTWFNATSLANAVANGSGISCGAQHGSYTSDGSTGGLGGLGSSSVGTTVHSGGNGSTIIAFNTQAGGGGGAGGPNGNGAAGGTVTSTGSYAPAVGGGGADGGAAGGSSSGGTPGAGGANGVGGGGGGAGAVDEAAAGVGTAEATWTSNPGGASAGPAGGGGGGGGAAFGSGLETAGGVGGNYGGGGGGGGADGSSTGVITGGNGAQGIIVITYTPLTGRVIRLTGGLILVGGIRFGGTEPIARTTSCSQATAFLARVSVDANHQADYTNLICGLVTDGIWSKLDVLYIFATQNSSAALTNLINSSDTATASGTPAFTADSGYSVSTGNFISTNYNFSTGTNYTQNSASFGGWSGSTVASYRYPFADSLQYSGNIFIEPKDPGNGTTAYTINGNTEEFATGAVDESGFWAVVRPDSVTEEVFRDTTLLGTSSLSSIAPDNAIYESGGDTSPYSGIIRAMFAGGALSAGDAANFYNLLNAYMSSIGATP